MPVEVDGAAAIKLDVKNAPGTDGASETYQGYEPSKPTVKFTIYTAQMWLDVQAMIREIKPKPGKTAPAPIEIVHPLLSILGLRKFYVEKMPVPKQVKHDQWEIVLNLVEWFAKPVKSGTGSAKSGGNSKTPALKTALDNPGKGGATPVTVNPGTTVGGAPSGTNAGPVKKG